VETVGGFYRGFVKGRYACFLWYPSVFRAHFYWYLVTPYGVVLSNYFLVCSSSSWYHLTRVSCTSLALFASLF
jgi:hypothetical protein